MLFPVITQSTSSNSASGLYTRMGRGLPHSSPSLFIVWTSFTESIVEFNVEFSLTALSTISHVIFEANRSKKTVKYSNVCKQNNHGIMNHVCKLLHLYQTIWWYKCASLRMWFIIPYYHKMFNFRCFRAMAHIRLWNWVQFCLFKISCCISKRWRLKGESKNEPKFRTFVPPPL